MKNFLENCKKVLKERKMSMRKLAIAIGLAPQTLQKWLNEEGNDPGLERFIQICQILEVSSFELLAIQPPPTSPKGRGYSHLESLLLLSCFQMVSVVTITTRANGDDRGLLRLRRHTSQSLNCKQLSLRAVSTGRGAQERIRGSSSSSH